MQGQPTGSDYTQKNVKGSPLPNLIEISDSYGTYANVGGKVDIKSGSINLIVVQEYDLQALWGDVSESGNRLNITKVFYEALQQSTDSLTYSVSGQRTLKELMSLGLVHSHQRNNLC